MLAYDLPWIALGAARTPADSGLLVGADAGATKTLVMALDLATGEVRSAATSAGNSDSVGVAVATEAVTDAVLQVAGADRIEQAVVAVAGTNPGHLVDALTAHPSLASGNLEVVNDVVAAWAVVDYCQDAIAIISGTGSHTLGVLDGRAVRVGGWGHVFGDEGSAYWMGREAVAVAARQLDGRDEQSGLIDALLGATGDPTVQELVRRLYANGALKHEIAALAVSVDEAAEAGDAVSRTIVEAAAALLYEHLQTLQAHDPRFADVPVGLVGSTWHSGGLRAAFERLAGARPGGLELISAPPVLGALAAAAVTSGHAPSLIRERAGELTDLALGI